MELGRRMHYNLGRGFSRRGYVWMNGNYFLGFFVHVFLWWWWLLIRILLIRVLGWRWWRGLIVIVQAVSIQGVAIF
jgi:hypothetical protein